MSERDIRDIPLSQLELSPGMRAIPSGVSAGLLAHRKRRGMQVPRRSRSAA